MHKIPDSTAKIYWIPESGFPFMGRMYEVYFRTCFTHFYLQTADYPVDVFSKGVLQYVRHDRSWTDDLHANVVLRQLKASCVKVTLVKK